jgi:hypothetical protein
LFDPNSFDQLKPREEATAKDDVRTSAKKSMSSALPATSFPISFTTTWPPEAHSDTGRDPKIIKSIVGIQTAPLTVVRRTQSRATSQTEKAKKANRKTVGTAHFRDERLLV